MQCQQLAARGRPGVTAAAAAAAARPKTQLRVVACSSSSSSSSSCNSITSSVCYQPACPAAPPQLQRKQQQRFMRPRPLQQQHSRTHQRQRMVLVWSVQPDTEEARSPLDAPQEWEAPQPSKRPDIFPEFEKPERVFLPKPLPGDPEMPDEEEEESKKRTEPGDPDPEAPPGEPSEPEPEPGTEPEKQPNIPNIPE